MSLLPPDWRDADWKIGETRGDWTKTGELSWAARGVAARSGCLAMLLFIPAVRLARVLRWPSRARSGGED